MNTGFHNKPQTGIGRLYESATAGSGFKDLFMRAGRLGEWQFLAHDGAQRAIFEPPNESGVDVRLFRRV